MNQITSPRERVNQSLNHIKPDRVPVDFLATVEVWKKLIEYLGLENLSPPETAYFDESWETLLRKYKVDCRIISYDQFFRPPDTFFNSGDTPNWWDALSRSTPNRMFRRIDKNGDFFDLWGHHMRVVQIPTGAYEEIVHYPLRNASPEDVRNYRWPDPDWWDFDPLQDVIDQLEDTVSYHLRYRAGSIFEAAWQLTGMDKFLMDLATDPKVPLMIMDHLTDITVEILERVLKDYGERLDMVYFYDDVATENSLMISRHMWGEFIQPRHLRLIEVARKYEKKVMYHCDGAIYPLIPDLIEMGIDVLNPIQVDAKNMEDWRLKEAFGSQLCFHGGIDNIHILPFGTPDDVEKEVKQRIKVLGTNGGYIMGSTHHIQSNTPRENVDAMYDINLRYT